MPLTRHPHASQHGSVLTDFDGHEAEDDAQADGQRVIAGVALQASTVQHQRLAVLVRERAICKGLQCSRACHTCNI